MLAKKFYAQRFRKFSKNNASVAPSSSNRIKNLKNRCCQDGKPTVKALFKRVPDITQSAYIEEKRIQNVQCTDDTNVTPKQRICANNKVCTITKDLTRQSQGEYIANSLPEKCGFTQPKKPFIKVVC